MPPFTLRDTGLTCFLRRFAAGFLILTGWAGWAQELEPGAYSPAPTGLNFFVVGDNYNSGDLSFDPAVPITDASARIHLAAVGYARTFGLAGRLANVGLGLPYARGDLEGLVGGVQQDVHRSAWGDPRLRFAVNLYGTPAMTPKEYASYRPGTIIGTSMIVSVPLGQYDSAKLINVGKNLWAFKPDIGISRAIGRWTLEAAAGVWIFSDNTEFYGGQTRSQDPIGSYQGHITYTFRPRMWLAFDANYYTGGRTTVGGKVNEDLQKNSRMGFTFALPLTKQQSLKFNTSKGARTTVGADFTSYGVAWQVMWR